MWRSESIKKRFVVKFQFLMSLELTKIKILSEIYSTLFKVLFLFLIMIYRTSDCCRRVIHNHRFHYPIFTATIFVLMNYLSYLQKFTKSIITVLNLLPACKYIFVSTKQQFSFSCLPFPYDSQSLMDFLLEHHAVMYFEQISQPSKCHRQILF